MRSPVKIGLLGLALVALLVIALIRIRGDRHAQQELQAVYAQIQPGASKSEVQAVFGAGQFRQLELREVPPESLLVQTPLKWGARNWVLWIELKEGRVGAVKIRFHDDRNIRPQEAPEDKVNSNPAVKP